MATGDKKRVLMQTDIGTEGGVAPAGYGLGGSCVRPADLDWNNATENGWYTGKVNTPDGAWFFGYVSKDEVGEIKQRAWDSTSGSTLEYGGSCAERTGRTNRETGVVEWFPWEWVNPPMKLGVEYRTTERYLGKPVYAMCFSTGKLGTAGTYAYVCIAKNHKNEDINAECLVSSVGIMNNDYPAGGPGALPMTGYGVLFGQDDGIISTHTIIEPEKGLQVWVYAPTRDLSTKTAYFTFKYTKTTD